MEHIQGLTFLGMFLEQWMLVIFTRVSLECLTRSSSKTTWLSSCPQDRLHCPRKPRICYLIQSKMESDYNECLFLHLIIIPCRAWAKSLLRRLLSFSSCSDCFLYSSFEKSLIIFSMLVLGIKSMTILPINYMEFKLIEYTS